MQGLSVQEQVLGVGVKTRAPTASALDAARSVVSGEEVNAMTQVIPKSRGRKVNGYVKAVLALEAVQRKREDRYDRFVRPLDRKRDELASQVAARVKALSGGQYAEARRLLAVELRYAPQVVGIRGRPPNWIPATLLGSTFASLARRHRGLRLDAQAVSGSRE